MTSEDEVLERLSRCGELRSHKIVVVIEDDCVTLRGVVSSFYQKQMAQEAVMPMLKGIMGFSNKIVVKHS